MIIARSPQLKRLVAIIAVGGFVSLGGTPSLDSEYATRPAVLRDAAALDWPGARLAFSATAYCKGLTTTSGVPAQAGIAASDPSLLPVGSVIDVDASDAKYNGIYTVMDTGPSIQGREVDLYMWNCSEALQFGRKPIHLTVLRLGWNPRATTPSLLERMFRRPGQAPLPSRPLPATDPHS
jgi:3D (Asp-Asp-Asp) domain-containing protein